MDDPKFDEPSEAQNPLAKTFKEACGSFGVVSNDTTLAVEAQKGADVNCSNNVVHTLEVADPVTEAEKLVDASEGERSTAVQDEMMDGSNNFADPSDVEKDGLANGAAILNVNSEIGEMKLDAEAVTAENGVGVGENVKRMCDFGDLGDRVSGDRKTCVVNDGFDAKITAVEVDNVEIAPQMVEAQKIIGDTDGETAFVGFNSMFTSEGDIGRVDGKEQHGMMTDVLDKENMDQAGSMELPLSTRLIGDGTKESHAKKVVVEEETEKELLCVTLSGVNSDKEIETSRDGITLLVDFSGNSHSLEKIASGEKSNLNEAKVEKDQINNRECGFSVGDVVWVQTKNQSWWPGRICDNADASKYDVRTYQSGNLLIQYFGSGHVTWCFPSQLKAFHDNFEYMSRQNKSRTFMVAVEKAAHEFGRRVKLHMSCSCFLNGRKPADGAQTSGEVSVLERRSSGLAEFSANHLESVRFLECLQGLARSVSIPGMLEVIVKQNILSAFHCFMGHSQLPIHQLQDHPGPAVEGFKKEALTSVQEKIGASQGLDHEVGSPRNDVAGGGGISKETESKDRNRKRKKHPEVDEGLEGFKGSLVGSSKEPGIGCIQSPKPGSKDFGPENKNVGGGGETRERKKSKYLSYPYVNWEHNGLSGKMEDPNVQKLSKDVADQCADDFVGSSSIVKSCSSKRFRKRWARKFMDKKIVYKNTELINIPSNESLSKLRFAAVNSLYPKEDDNFDFVEWFFSRFRISVYHDESIDEMHVRNMVGENEAIAADSITELNEKSKLKRQRKNSMSKHSEATSLQNLDSNAETSPKVSLPVSLETSHVSTGLNKSLSSLSDVDINMDASDMLLSNTREMSPVTPRGKPERKRKKKNVDVTSIHLQARQVATLPDLNGNNAISASGDADVDGNRVEPGSLWVDLKLTGPTALENNQQQNGGNRITAGFSNSDGKSEKTSLMIQFAPVLTLATGEGKPIRRRRKRKERATSDGPSTCLAPGIPDLNGASPDPVSFGKNFKEIGAVPPQANPGKRKRRRKGENVLKGQQNRSIQGRVDIGTALLMTFAPGTSMPSKEDLMAAFCGFGPLKESETHSLKDSGTAQVVFMRSADGIEAFQSLGKCNPFGPSLVNYRLHQQSTVSMASEPNKTPNMSEACMPIEGFLTPARPSGPNLVSDEAPPLDVIKQNLEMMTSVLEKSGDNLPPEMRNKLEGEIKSLLMKVSNMASSSAS